MSLLKPAEYSFMLTTGGMYTCKMAAIAALKAHLLQRAVSTLKDMKWWQIYH